MSFTPVKRPVYLLPNYFKWVGAAVVISAVIVFIFQTQYENLLSFDEDYGVPTMLLLGGLALVNFAQEKKEDERIRRIRYRTWAYSFYLFVGYVFFGRIYNMFFESTLQFYNSATALSITILLMNLAFFEGNKYNDNIEE